MSEQIDNCVNCGGQGTLKEKLVTVYRHRGDQHFIFEQVPAQVCEQCGHRYFSMEVAEEMDNLMDAPESQSHARPVPVIPFGIH
jgi:YgiT-type zinc finger domain-containing protein